MKQFYTVVNNYELFSISDCRSDRVSFIPLGISGLEGDKATKVNTFNELNKERVDICSKDTLPNGRLDMDYTNILVESTSDQSSRGEGFAFSYQAQRVQGIYYNGCEKILSYFVYLYPT